MDNQTNQINMPPGQHGGELAVGLWAKLSALLRVKLSQQLYATWFDNVIPVDYNEKEGLVLKVASNFDRMWISKRYLPMLEDMLSEITSESVKINIAVDESLASPSDTEPGPPGTPSPLHQDNESEARASGAPDAEDKEHDGQADPSVRSNVLPWQLFTFDSFVVGDSNRLAYNACRRVAENLSIYNPLIIYGGTGLGKTHLLRAIQQYLAVNNPELKTLFVSSEGFMNDFIYHLQKKTIFTFRNQYRTADVILIDDIQDWDDLKQATQNEFLNTFNDLQLNNRQIVVSSNVHPSQCQLSAPIKSRFDSGLAVAVKAPSLETRVAILRVVSERENLSLPDKVYQMIANRFQSSIRQLEGALKKISNYAETHSCQNITLDVATNALSDLPAEKDERITIDDIIHAVSRYFGNVTYDELISASRKKSIAYPRHLAMYLCRHLTEHSLPEIGERFGGRDHTTVLHALNKIKGELSQSDSKTYSDYHAVTEKFNRNPNLYLVRT